MFCKMQARGLSRSFSRSVRCLNSVGQFHETRDEDTHFGFQTVKQSEKGQKVREVFENVAQNYNQMNDAMSLGIHRLWKDVFMCRLGPTENTKLIDMAGGTGDIAFRFLNYVKNNNVDENCHVTVCDINPKMLEVGRERCKNLNYSSDKISWKEENAENLKFDSDSFNAYTIAFGVRNCTHIDRVLSEAYRVLKPGGRFLCLEFSHVENEALRWLYDQYSFQVIPVLGHIIAGQWLAYQYLVESIRKFPNQETFKTLIEEAGFRQVTFENLSFGIVSIHSGFKL